MTLAFPPRLDARVRQPVHGLVAFLLPGLWPPNASSSDQMANRLTPCFRDISSWLAVTNPALNTFTPTPLKGPATALWLLAVFDYHYSSLFAVTLLPGLLAAGLIAFLVVEKQRMPIPHVSFGERLQMLPTSYRRFLVAVGLFGAGDFAHTLLILLATQKLSPTLGATKATSVAVALYVLHNVFYAGFAFVAGWLADHFRKNLVLATGYALAAVMAIVLIALPPSIWMLGAVFTLGRIYVGIEETLEDSLCAMPVAISRHSRHFLASSRELPWPQ